MFVFWQVSRDRPQHFGGPGSITLQSLIFYQQLFEDALNRDDIETLQAIDRAYLKAVREVQEEK